MSAASRFVFAYIDEPPFALPGAKGCDVELALAGLRAIGAPPVETVLTTFGELLPGLEEGRWQMTTALFITPERAPLVHFSLPVWALGDGFIVQKGNPKGLRGFADFGEGNCLAVIRGQVQRDSALRGGVPAQAIRTHETQEGAVAALMAGEVDAYVSTALGNRSFIAQSGNAALESVVLDPGTSAPQGAFAFARSQAPWRQRFDVFLADYLGTPAHRAFLSRWGLGAQEIDPVLRRAKP